MVWNAPCVTGSEPVTAPVRKTWPALSSAIVEALVTVFPPT